jgi:hypothetical protein
LRLHPALKLYKNHPYNEQKTKTVALYPQAPWLKPGSFTATFCKLIIAADLKEEAAQKREKPEVSILEDGKLYFGHGRFAYVITTAA